jgi:enediyne biosynthesis protein E4
MGKLLIATGALLGVAGTVGYWSLVPGEANRPPPASITEPAFTPLEVPFTHSWMRETSHPLLAAAAIDIDGDGRDEVFLGGSDGAPDGLLAWRNGKLVDIAKDVGIGDEAATYGALSLDMDADGAVDLLTVGHSGIDIWLNKAGRFERRPLAIAIPNSSVPMAITAGDFDRDGLVDLYVSMFVAPKLFRSPVFNDPDHAKGNLLLRNNGDLNFTDVTGETAKGLQNTFTSSFADLDGDRLPDLVLAQNTGEVEILRNLGNGKFKRADIRTGYGFWMGQAFGDVDQDGDLDVFLTNLGNSIPGPLVKGDRQDDQTPNNEWILLRNDGDFKFTDITEPSGLTGYGFAWGAVFEDVNLDGAPDLLVAQNYVKWPVHKLFGLPGKLLLGAVGESTKFWTSDGAANGDYGHVPLIADLDGDGRNDIVWANMDGSARAYLNTAVGNFISVRLPDTPAAIGARIWLEGFRAASQVNIAGEGLTSDRTTQRTFGLGKGGPAPRAVVVEWAGGGVTRVAAPQLNTPISVSPPTEN